MAIKIDMCVCDKSIVQELLSVMALYAATVLS